MASSPTRYPSFEPFSGGFFGRISGDNRGMSSVDETCWTMVQEAAGGDHGARSIFARTYLDVVRAYLGARWRGSPLRDRLDDAVQDVFMDCFRAQGALGRADRDLRVGFRTFLYGVVRNIARRHEERVGKKRDRDGVSGFDADAVEAADEPLSRVWDRAWARTILQRAGERQRLWAETDGPPGRRRIALLKLRFGEGVPIREIAKRWDMAADQLHAEYRRAREEFKRALREEVAFHNPDAPRAVEKECERLLGLLQ